MRSTSKKSLYGRIRTSHLKRGNYRKLGGELLEQLNMLTTFFVDGDAPSGGTGAPNDPFNTIQAAVDAAAESPGGDFVSLSPGTYQENVSISDPNRLNIRGNGATVTSNGDEDHTIQISDSADVSIRDLKITGATDDGIRAKDVGSLNLENIEATGNGDEGVQATRMGSVVVRHVNFSDNGGDGIKVDKDDEDPVEILGAQSVRIVGGNFSRNDDGLDLENVGSIQVVLATANGNLDEGLEVDDSGSIKVIGGVFNNNAEAGLDIDNTVKVSVTAVIATNNGEHGLQIEAETSISDVKVSNSVFSNNVGDGIQIVEDGGSVAKVSITNVIVANNTEIEPGEGGHGLFIEISGDLKLRNVLSIDNDNDDVLP